MEVESIALLDQLARGNERDKGVQGDSWYPGLGSGVNVVAIPPDWES